jgi:hypothetical protein
LTGNEISPHPFSLWMIATIDPSNRELVTIPSHHNFIQQYPQSTSIRSRTLLPPQRIGEA